MTVRKNAPRKSGKLSAVIACSFLFANLAFSEEHNKDLLLFKWVERVEGGNLEHTYTEVEDNLVEVEQGTILQKSIDFNKAKKITDLVDDKHALTSLTTRRVGTSNYWIVVVGMDKVVDGRIDYRKHKKRVFVLPSGKEIIGVHKKKRGVSP